MRRICKVCCALLAGILAGALSAAEFLRFWLVYRKRPKSNAPKAETKEMDR